MSKMGFEIITDELRKMLKFEHKRVRQHGRYGKLVFKPVIDFKINKNILLDDLNLPYDFQEKNLKVKDLFDKDYSFDEYDRYTEFNDEIHNCCSCLTDVFMDISERININDLKKNNIFNMTDVSDKNYYIVINNDGINITIKKIDKTKCMLIANVYKKMNAHHNTI